MTPSDGLTVRVKLVLAELKPSLTVSVMIATPVWPDSGVTVTVRLEPLPTTAIPVVVTSVGFEESLVTVSVSFSASLTVKGMAGVAVLMEVIWFAMAEMDGAPTVRRNVPVVELTPSSTDEGDGGRALLAGCRSNGDRAVGAAGIAGQDDIGAPVGHQTRVGGTGGNGETHWPPSRHPQQ